MNYTDADGYDYVIEFEGSKIKAARRTKDVN